MSIVLTNPTDETTPGTGTPIDAAWVILLKAAIDALIGNWTAVSFNAGNFTANGAMTWTVGSGDVSRNRYQLINKTLHWQVTLLTTTVGGTPNTQLLITIPTGAFSDAASRSFNVQANDNGTLRDAQVQVVDGTHLGILLQSGGNWAASTNLTNIALDVSFELA